MSHKRGRATGRLADMSLPSKLRLRKRQKTRRAIPPAQMDHGQGAKASRRRREDEKKVKQWRR